MKTGIISKQLSNSNKTDLENDKALSMLNVEIALFSTQTLKLKMKNLSVDLLKINQSSMHLIMQLIHENKPFNDCLLILHLIIWCTLYCSEIFISGGQLSRNFIQ